MLATPSVTDEYILTYGHLTAFNIYRVPIIEIILQYKVATDTGYSIINNG